MLNYLSSLGWFGFAAGLVYYFIRDRYGDPALIQDYVWHTQVTLIVSATLIVAGYLLRYVKQTFHLGPHNRCKRCHKKIPTTETYCFDHRREAIWEAQEKYRLEGTDKFTRTQKRA